MRGGRAGRGGVTLLIGVTVAAIIASAIFVFRVRHAESSPNRRLAAAVGAHRVTRARLTGGFAYAPCDTVTPNDSLISGLLCERTNPSQWRERNELVKVANETRRSTVSSANNASHRHAVGLWHVVWGNTDTAIEELRAATDVEPKNARLQSDLAAALLARAEWRQDPQSILAAHTAADSAVALDPALPEARFNRAVALEWLHLRTAAIAAWSSYLEVDDRSPWADEARQRHRSLRVARPDWPSAKHALHAAVSSSDDSISGTIARQFPARVREEVRLTAVDWARAHRAGTTGADTLLSRSLALARALAAATADSLWLDVVAGLIRASEARDHIRLDATARGLVAHANGDAYLKQFRPDSAAPWLIEAERALATAESPARYLATYGLAVVAYLERSFGEALTTLRRVRTTAPTGYRLVRALAARSEGVIEGAQANFHAANAAYLTAMREASGSGDAGLELRPRAALATNLAILGLNEVAWGHLYTALRLSERYAEASTDGGVPTFAMAARLSARRAPQAASLFQQESVRLASLTASSRRDTLEMIYALGRQAELLGRAGRSNQALESVRKARAYIASIEPDSIKAFYAAETDLIEGIVLLGERPDSALRVLRRVIDAYRHPRYRFELDRALLVFANAYAAVGAMDSAQAAFERAMTETERRRSDLTGPEDRARFLDQARPVIDRILAFLVERGDTVGALDFFERMRSRALLESVLDKSPNAKPPTPIGLFRSRLPRGTSIVSYAVLNDELVIWLVRADGVFMYRRPGVGQLEQLANRLSTLVAARSPDSGLRSVAGALHAQLIAPFEDRVDPGSRLIFVPDKWLHFVPFAALFDTTARRFVVEKFETGVTPSLQLYAQSVSRYEQLRGSRSLSVLAVGNPAFDAQLLSLPALPGAEAEAKRVAALYPGARLLVRHAATRRAVLHGAANSSVVHFAGHGVVRPDAPLLSHLVLAPDPGTDASGMLTAQELFESRLPNTRLAILSGCHTASGRLSDTEGASSLARALFAAGVPSVVASLWSVEDEDTAEFFVNYHRRLVRGDDPTTALRRTQLEWIERDKAGWQGLSTWAAFVIFGATATGTLE